MRRKVTVAAMADDDVSRTNPSSQGSQGQRQVDVGQFARRLGCMASSTAQALYAIVHMKFPLFEAQSLAKLAQKIYALAAVLSSLREDLIQSGEQDVWTKEHGESLLRSLRECEGVFQNIILAVRKADETLGAPAKSMLTTGEAYVKGCVLSDEQKALSVVEKCFGLAIQSHLVSRHAALARKKHLDEDEIPEASRLILAFRNPVLNDVSVSRNKPFASEQLREYSMPSAHSPAHIGDQAESEIEVSAPAERSNIGDSILRRPTPIGLYNQWPPFGNPQHPAYLAAKARGCKDDDGKPVIAPSLATYASTSKGLSESGQSSERLFPPAPTPKVVPGTISFGEPSVIKPTSSGSSLFTKAAPSGAFANYSQSWANQFTPTLHLEAYVLRPNVHSTDTTSTLSYGIESLRLSEETMQAQVRSLGPTYSVVDTLLDLQPQQLHLIQLRAIQRQGNIVSVEHGKPVSLTMLMGSLQVKPALFIISTTTMLPQFPAPLPFPLPAPDPTPDSVPATGGSILRGIAPAPGFGPSNSNSAISTSHHLSSPEAYSKHLQEQGELCNYVEGTDIKGRFQHYQTITMNKDWHDKDRSLEEVRLADYKAKRKGPMKTNEISYPWDQSKVPFGGFGRFGGPRPLPPKEVKISKTGWFPTTIRPSAPGYAFGDGAPKFGQPTQGVNASSKSSLNIFDNFVTPRVVPHDSGPFGHVAPNLPPFVPPQDPGKNVFNCGPAFTRPPLFGGQGGNAWDACRASPSTSSGKLPNSLFNPPGSTNTSKPSFGPSTNSDGFCAVQHQHGPFCRAQPVHKFHFGGTYPSFEDGDITSAYGPPSCMLCRFEGRVCRCYDLSLAVPPQAPSSSSDKPSSAAPIPSLFESAPTWQDVPKPSLFGGAPATRTYVSPFTALAKDPNYRPFGAAPPSQRRGASLFGATSSIKPTIPSSSNSFGTSVGQPPSLFGLLSSTAPAAPPAAGGLFGNLGSTASKSTKKDDSPFNEQEQANLSFAVSSDAKANKGEATDHFGDTNATEQTEAAPVTTS
ncbi:hypothetical protein BU25DRAFT_206284 [Macroventuria anomochaeta]|uniref:Uncharacterized protein n=1 Tax=Macroventuria anomochaeta TaxID=301207 RepID=A0ACB6RL29_9PLEO|nr:uncharacterized protein BU25DRAFT_206284 [Macroventuria anomochaeta]KAF2622576.1 hypothetical protein BU25DRAFT_206284 [Macroventuria anomochaeta]